MVTKRLVGGRELVGVDELTPEISVLGELREVRVVEAEEVLPTSVVRDLVGREVPVEHPVVRRSEHEIEELGLRDERVRRYTLVAGTRLAQTALFEHGERVDAHRRRVAAKGSVLDSGDSLSGAKSQSPTPTCANAPAGPTSAAKPTGVA
jgi:hypothetical protein